MSFPNNQQFDYDYSRGLLFPKPTSGKIRAARVAAFLGIVGIIAALSVYFSMKKRQGQTMSVVAPQYMTSDHKDLDPMSFMEKGYEPPMHKPISTPTTLGSKYGLGGGPLVGSQSIRLGGSTFLPGQNLVPHNDAQFESRPPTGVKWSTMSTSPAATLPPSQVAPPMSNPLPGRRLVDNAQPGVQISRPTPSIPAAPPAATPSMSLPLMDELESTRSEMAPTMLASAPLSRGKGKGSYFMGAPPSPNQIPQSMSVDTRDGKIIQPR